MFLSWTRGAVHRLGFQGSYSSQLGQSLESAIIQLCDVQLVTGLGLLTSGYILLENCGLDACHWQMIVYLAWFSTVTHLSGLAVLRAYSACHSWSKYFRYSLMLVLLVMLLVAMVPTGFFNWASHGSAAAPGSFASCYFDLAYGKARYYEGGPERPLWRDQTWESMLFPAALLVFGFSVRTVKLFRPLARALNEKPRCWLSSSAQSVLVKLAMLGPRTPSVLGQLYTEAIVTPVLAAFLMLRVSTDIFNSMLAEIYWLMTILIWGTVKVISARQSIDRATLENESQWTFGQILPAILLFAPIVTAIGAFELSDSLQTLQQLPGSSNAIQISTDSLLETQDSAPDLYVSVCHGGEFLVPQSLLKCRIYQIDDCRPSLDPRLSILARWMPREKLYIAPWVAVIVACPCISAILLTILSFTTLFKLDSRLEPDWPLYDLWIFLQQLPLVLIGHPAACTLSIMFAILMGEWKILQTRTRWKSVAIAVFACFGYGIEMGLVPVTSVFKYSPLAVLQQCPAVAGLVYCCLLFVSILRVTRWRRR
ncbi:hypothetical protein F5Y15DRAFT_27845 [Xylariaceae sp. FL0016]|nr:hypothetical protein F5Y15DRAFT_27845 [Xylariaceae sp. FL0016]